MLKALMLITQMSTITQFNGPMCRNGENLWVPCPNFALVGSANTLLPPPPPPSSPSTRQKALEICADHRNREHCKYDQNTGINSCVPPKQLWLYAWRDCATLQKKLNAEDAAENKKREDADKTFVTGVAQGRIK